MTAQDWPHLFRPGDPGRPVLVALHGTGGDEADMLPLASAVAPGWAVLSPRGAVREGSANRWFRRFAEGVFDLDDLTFQAAALATWLQRSLAGRPAVALGYSNGANMAGALLLEHPGLLVGAVLMRAQFTLPPQPGASLAGAPVLILSGNGDPIVPSAESAKLASVLETVGAAVTHQISGDGHHIAAADADRASQFLRAHFTAKGDAS